ncbi:synaptonemal complex protein 1 isoform X2 [Parambassis ranga]|nr:synaptonemal complex protein 1 isoform X2 [Parambassis ranga]
MDRDRGFNFKLLVPPRVKSGQISAVRPQEKAADSCVDFMNMLQQSQTEQSMAVPPVLPTKPTRQDFTRMKVVQPMEKDENICSMGQLYTKLFDEVEKMQCWKAKVDSDTAQKERKLQDNKRTMETQRKAIQELQFEVESLSIKLEEQMGENEDLRNKNGATTNLCHVLKETFQWTTEKMQLFESEREETHQLFMQNSETIKKMVAAFESLHLRVEADQQEMEKVKEDVLQFEDLKQKYYQEYKMKDEEVGLLHTKLKEKESELQNLLLELNNIQKHSRELQEATDQQLELVKSYKAEQESLLQKLHNAELRCKEAQKSQEAAAAALEQSKKEYAQIIRSKELSLQELNRIKDQHAEKMEQIQKTVQELRNSLASEIQKVEELEHKLLASNNELEKKNTLIENLMKETAKKDGLIKIIEDKLDIQSKSIESMKGKIDASEARMEELVVELSKKAEENQTLKNEAERTFAETHLLKQACEAAERAQEGFMNKATLTEIKVQELEGQLVTELKKSKECSSQMERLKETVMEHEAKYQELLSAFNELQSEKMTIQQQCENRLSDVKSVEAVIKKSEEELKGEIQRLEEENQRLQRENDSFKTRIQDKCEEAETLYTEIDAKFELLQEHVTEKENQIKAVGAKLRRLGEKLQMKSKAQEEYKKENKLLKKQIAKEIEKSSQLETVVNSLNEESHDLTRLKEDHQKLLEDLNSKSTFTAELENEVKRLRLTSAEAVKNKEDTELKCQQKIADMLALMEKHKSQYDRMVEEKDAELDEKKKKEIEAVAHAKALELDLSKHQKEIEDLKKQLKTEPTEKSTADSRERQGSRSQTPSSKMHIFDFSRTWKTPFHSKDDGSNEVMKKVESAAESIGTHCGATRKTKPIRAKHTNTPGGITERVGRTSKIESYRVLTPPSAEKTAKWPTIELDPKSDSPVQKDLLTFVDVPTPAPHCKLSIFDKIQSPATRKSPGSSLKQAAMKRMRDAGWTAVTGRDIKKKKTSEKIFA